MKRFLLFFLPIVLTAVFLMPATVQAKTIKYSKDLILEGKSSFPGEGTLTCGDKLILTGFFTERELKNGTLNGNSFFARINRLSDYAILPKNELTAMHGFTNTNFENVFESEVKDCKFSAFAPDGNKIIYEGKAIWGRCGKTYYIILNGGSMIFKEKKVNVLDKRAISLQVFLDGTYKFMKLNFSYPYVGDPIPYNDFKFSESDALEIKELQGSKPKSAILECIYNYDINNGENFIITGLLAIFDRGEKVYYEMEDHKIARLNSIKWPNEDFYLADCVNDFPYERLITSGSYDDERAITELTKKRIDPYEGKVFMKRTFGSSSISVSTLHENHPILTGKFNYIGHKEDVGVAHHISYSDGNNFRGKIRNKDTFINRFIKANTPSEIGIEYHNGLLTDKDEIVRGYYFRGMNKEQLEKAAQKETEEIKRRKAEKDKELQDYYDNLCQKYGKKYVDAALKAEIIVGMPEELVFKRFGNELSPRYDSFSSKSFWWNKPKVIWNKGENSHYYYIVNIDDGKVSSVIK